MKDINTYVLHLKNLATASLSLTDTCTNAIDYFNKMNSDYGFKLDKLKIIDVSIMETIENQVNIINDLYQQLGGE